ncbi:MAG: DUF4261 domain-containing protein [Polyangiaceae bacterium]|nr:DUF4261 domain-containing protein [Polyangiaceae bacterium]MCB9609623.1 DUF4261 domain-containing protein [Polyangiaceae bacterium]
MTSTMRLAMVPLNVSQLPAAQALCDAYAREWPEQSTLKPAAAAPDGTGVTLDGAKFAALISLNTAPIPASDLEPTYRAALHWPEAKQSIEGHVAHLVVTVISDELGAIDVMLELTRVVGACLLTSEAAGVFWGGGSLVNGVDAFLDDAREMSREYLPLYLWVRFGLMRDKNNTATLYTLGMDQFDLMEVEFVRSKLDLETLTDRAFNVAHHLLDNGAVLSDRDTIGLTPSERFLVRHRPSVVDPDRTVYSLAPARK